MSAPEEMKAEKLERQASIEREFQQWRTDNEGVIRREMDAKSFVTAWAKVAWHANWQRDLVGRELAKAQRRIHRQRVANREMKGRLELAMDRIMELNSQVEALKKEYNRERARTD